MQTRFTNDKVSIKNLRYRAEKDWAQHKEPEEGALVSHPGLKKTAPKLLEENC